MSVCSAFTHSRLTLSSWRTAPSGPSHSATTTTTTGRRRDARRGIHRSLDAACRVDVGAVMRCVPACAHTRRFRKLTATSIKCHALARRGAARRSAPEFEERAHRAGGLEAATADVTKLERFAGRRKRRVPAAASLSLSCVALSSLLLRRRRRRRPADMACRPYRKSSRRRRQVVIYLVMTRRPAGATRRGGVASVTKHPCRARASRGTATDDRLITRPDVRPSPVDIVRACTPKLY